MDCSIRVRAFAALSGTMVYKLVTSQPSLEHIDMNNNFRGFINALDG